MTIPVEPQEAEVLRAIGDLLARPRSAAALAHYPTLRIQTANLRAALKAAIDAGEQVAVSWSERLGQDRLVVDEFRPATSPLHPYRIIAPALVRNLNRTSEFLLDEASPAAAVDVERVGETVPSFSDFVRLGAAARVFLDAVVQTAFQLVAFDGRQLNYKFLHSLQGFAPVAPPSLHGNIYSSEIQVALTRFAAMSSVDIKNSHFVTRSNEQFGQRLKVSGEHVGLIEQRRRNIELLYSFCSDFVHSGYVSTIAVSEAGPGIIMGGRGDAFTAHAENFAELKQRLLAECAGAYADLLIPALLAAVRRTLTNGAEPAWVSALNTVVFGVETTRAVLNRELVEPLRKTLVGSDATIRIDCVCGGRLDWQPPHHEWDAFCSNCGSRFRTFLVDEDVDYIVSPSGPGDVNGGDAPRIRELEPDLTGKLARIVERHRPAPQDDGVPFVLIHDLARCDEESLKAPALIVAAPIQDGQEKCVLYAFVAAKSLERCAVVRIRCNCGLHVDYRTHENTNVCRCGACGRSIGLLGVSGGGTDISIQNPDGTLGLAPIQALQRFASSAAKVPDSRGKNHDL
ncbi:MAG: hypothetical protein WCC64_04965 [Aliidongia sp.]